jgi:subtilisin
LGSRGRELKATTNEQGEVRFEFSDFWSASAVVAVPAGGFWPMILRGPSNPVVFDCPPLPDAREHLGWWHHRLGSSSYDEARGAGIRVGVIDTGVGPHPYLAHVEDLGAFIEGAFIPDGGADVDSHGSHVCGTIGARPTSASDYAGIAPGLQLFSARVFPANGGANQLDIVNAIDELSGKREVDLINMSLGAAQGSEIERDAILDALERGTLCVCAAGNSNGTVEFPAAFPETIAISAIGLLGWGPPGSMPSTRLPLEVARFGDGNLFHANFSCFGAPLVAAGPGVGIISTVPARFGLTKPYASMDGTSMASPAVCGILAAILSNSSAYKVLPRNDARSAMALQLLQQTCQSIGLDSRFQGRGMPQV